MKRYIYQVRAIILLFILIMTLLMLGWPLPGICENNNVLKIDNTFLSKHLPKIKNPRLMIDSDISRKYEKKSYREEGFGFVVTGDFNKDGNTDYAVVGKYDAPLCREKCMFVAIFSQKKHNDVILNYFDTFKNDRAFLFVEKGQNLKIEEIYKKYDVILVVLAVGSDDGFAIAWDGKNYIKTIPEY